MAIITLLLGLLIRLLFIPAAGFKADMAFWKGWGLAVADKGILWLVKNTNYNYPPGFAYVLYLINKTYALFQSPYATNQYWADNNILYLFLVKIITIAADVGVFFLILKITELIQDKPKKTDFFRSIIDNKLGLIAAAIYFLNPAAIYDGVLWGQVDQFGLMIFLLSIYFLLTKKPLAATVVFVISFMMKFQNIVFIPLFFIYIYKKFSFKSLISAVTVCAAAFLVISWSFWFNKEAAALIRLLTINSDWFPFYSLNAFNFWWIKSGLNGLGMVDKDLIIGVLNAKQTGFLVFILAYFISAVMLFFSKQEDLFKKFILALSLAVFSFFHLLTQSHERYLFPLLGFLSIYFIYLGEKKRRNFLIFYAVFSLCLFLNMYISMFFNYPDQVIWPLGKAVTLNMTFYLSLAQIAVFGYFFVVYLVREFAGQLLYVGVMAGLLVSAVFVSNYGYLSGQPVSLTKLTPIDYRQDYLEPRFNKNLNSYFNPNDFDRLSSSYFFYDRGIASHANSNITYGLNGKFSRFRSDYGLDTEAPGNAEVYFSIVGDGRQLFKSVKKGRFDYPATIDIDISGVKVLVLKIDKGGESINGDHGDWLDPVVIR